MALEVGIVGPSGGGKTALFTALTKTGGGEYGKTNVGMAPIADERLGALAEVVKARKITPATIRVQDVPGSGAAQLGNLRQVDALLVVLRGFGSDATPDDDLETFKLELLVADRDHVERRLERVEKQAKSGDAKIRGEVEELRKVLAHVDAGGELADYEGELPGELEPLTTKPLIAIVNGPAGIDLKLEAELAELPDEEAEAFRDGSESALDEIAGRLRERPRPDHLLHGGRTGHAGLDACATVRPRSTRPVRSTRTSPAASSAARSSTGTTWSSSVRTPRWPSTASRASRARRTWSRTATC